MRRTPPTLLAAFVLLVLAVPAARAAGTTPLTRALSAGMHRAGSRSSAEVVDLSTGQRLFADAPGVARIPASVEKIYTTSTVLDTFGPSARLSTTVSGTGRRRAATYDGTLYLRGGGDPTFGSASFDRHAYHAGATVQSLAAQLRARGIRRIDGTVVVDASLLDSDEGTVATHNRPSIDMEGALGALTFNRDWANADGTVYWAHPAIEAGRQLVAALAAAGVGVAGVRVRAGRTPARATLLATVRSPTMAALIHLTNTPSDNFFAETLLKDVGARYGAAGSTPAGAAVVRATVAARFGLHPHLVDGSGLSYADHTSPAQVISLLTQQRHDSAFRNSLSILGRTGTLLYQDAGTDAAGRCAGKTGTLTAVSNVVGYCAAANGDTLAYAFLMNGVDVNAAHDLQAAMQLALARYDGSAPSTPAGGGSPLSNARRPASSSTRTPSFSARASLVPALSPATR